MSDSSAPEVTEELPPNTIRLRGVSPYAGPRAVAAAARVRALEIVSSGEVARIDVDGVAVMTPAFADECFGELFDALGEEGFRKSIEVHGASDACRVLMEAVVQRRAGPGEHPAEEEQEQVEEEVEEEEVEEEVDASAEVDEVDEVAEAEASPPPATGDQADPGAEAAAEAAYLEDDDDDDFTEIE